MEKDYKSFNNYFSNFEKNKKNLDHKKIFFKLDKNKLGYISKDNLCLTSLNKNELEFLNRFIKDLSALSLISYRKFMQICDKY